jgi:hypothetical protein
MLYTLFETLRQIDPYVQLNDGMSVASVRSRLMNVDPTDLTQYALRVDGMGRLLIYRLNLRGFPIQPAAFVEEKAKVVSNSHNAGSHALEFGFSIPGYV